MDGEIDPTELLDCVIFRTSSSQNSFEAFACNKEKREKVASGLLKKLELHLPVLRKSEPDLNGDYRFQLDESRQGSSWFTKATLSRFLLIVNEPELFKSANTIQNELNQLEDTRRFHLMLYKKDNGAHTGGLGAGGNCLEDTSHQVKKDTLTSDTTKNELLRALDVRVLALSEELASNFSRALGDKFSKIQLSELVSFVECFGASELRDSLLKFISLKFKYQDAGTSYEPSSSNDSDDRNEKSDEVTSSTHSKNHIQNAIKTGVSPAKIAQAERQISSESEDSDSSNDVRSYAERSRPAIRSASPRRSASPMRRIQIGRSGSRRSTALAIKSINYFPPRERTNFNRDGNDNDIEDESPECQPKRSENAVLRMSVQDRINLFERKQKDQTSDTPERSSSTEATLSTKKSVLRRWSAGMGDSSTPCQQENKCDDEVEVPSENLAVHAKTSIEETSDNPMPNSKQPVNVVDILSLEVESTSPSPINNSIELVASQSEGPVSRSKTSADWTRQKEAELEQMFKQMMQSKPAKVGGKTSGRTRKQGSSNEQKGNLYSQYKAKQDEKLHTEITGKGTEKETKLRVKQNKLDNRKAEVAAKVAGVSGKLDSSTQKEKTRRKSSPPVLSKTPATNSVSTRKASPRTSGAMPGGRNSISSLPSTRSARTPSTKAAPGMTNNTTTNRKKLPQVMPSPTRPSPRAERPKQSKISKDPLTENTPNSKTQEEKKKKMASKNSKTVKTKTSTVVDSSASPVKPSFYNKVTKKGTVVPLEPKSFLRKGTGVSAGANATLLAKTQPSQPDSFSKHTESVDQDKNEPVSEIVVEMTPSLEESPGQIIESVDLHLDNLLKTAPTDEKTTEVVPVQLAAEVSSCVPQLTEFPITDFQVDDDSGISSTAWVEIDPPEGVTSYEDNIPKDVKPADAALVTLCTSPRVRHSLSQMLQAESSEPDIVEWGNAEVPPALIYQKDAPKGLKRLLNFARKSKGDSGSNGWSSPSVFSEGEEDTEEPKAVTWKKIDASSGKLAFKTKASGLQITMLSERHDSGNSSKSSTGHSASMNRFPSGPQGLREGSASTTSSKASRSFFSLSTFKSNK